LILAESLIDSIEAAVGGTVVGNQYFNWNGGGECRCYRFVQQWPSIVIDNDYGYGSVSAFLVVAFHRGSLNWSFRIM